ncbi:MAG: Gfo/Idh/MocA family oxidoreductase [Spirochaetes bacterium]|nr:Gfo/Idh/MocA family oxidoreductase [Spirochaetota bacterium]
MEPKIRVGVIGLGMGKGHLKSFQEHPHCEVAAICDQNPERLAQVAKEFGVEKTFTDATAMFDAAKLDAVSVCTPNKFHAPLTLEALDRGLHVLCEKPMAMNTAEALEMEARAKKRDRRLMINFSYRFNAMSQALRREVDRGTFGDFYFGRTVWHRRRGMPGFGGWFGDKDLAGGGPLIDLGVHRIDLALWLMGYPEPQAVFGSTYAPLATEAAARENKKFTVEDLAAGIVKFKNGATLIVEASWAAHVKHKEEMVTRLCGTRGGLVQQNVGGEYQFTCEIYSDQDGDFFTRTLDFTKAAVPSAMHEFIDSIREHRAPSAPGEHGVKVMKILDGIYESARTGREVRF